MLKKHVAVFDVDGTLLDGDSLLLAARHSTKGFQKIFAWLCLLPWCIGFQLKLVSAARLKEAFLRLFSVCRIVNHARERLLLDNLISRLRPEALDRLLWHKSQGHKVVLCSASPRILLQSLADWLGVDLVCTELIGRPGAWQPKLLGSNCKGEEKVRRLINHLGPFENLFIEAYGDSRGDRELLKAADRPHYRSFIDQPIEFPLFSLTKLLPVLGLALLLYGLLAIWSQGPNFLLLLRKLWPQVLAGLVLVLFGYAIRFYRWRLLLEAVNQQPPIAGEALIWMGSYAFTATPGKAGEALRALFLKEKYEVPISSSLLALMIERLSDVGAVLLLLLINLPLLNGWPLWVVLPGTFFVFVGVLRWWLLNNPEKVSGLVRWMEQILPRKIASSSDDVFLLLKKLLQLKLLLLSTLIGSISWSLEGISLWLLLQGFGGTEVSIGGATLAHTSAGLLGAITLMPGGLGSTEVGTVGLLALQGVPLIIATPATLLIRMMTLWFATGLGVICLILNSRR